MLLDLFRVELENHTRVLENGLVSAEEDQSPEKIEPLMRASHSIKGAARIVGLTAAVSLAHAMEDVLSAAQQGKLILTSEHVDLLLKANDTYASMIGIDTAAIEGWLGQREGELDAMARTLRESLTARAAQPGAGTQAAPQEVKGPPGTPAAEVPPPATPAAGKAPAAPEETVPAVQKREEDAAQPRKAAAAEKADKGLVRVMTEHLDRLMGLAGECLVQAQSIKAFYPALLKIRKGFPALTSSLENILQSLDEEAVPETCARLRESLEGIERLYGRTVGHTVDFELSSRRLENLAHRLYGEVVASRMQPF